ncbi:hypothetical protein BBP40_000667 [Aspergillus hancockii]|nr:hypothetical protein BBP40_000667 [Aspergillus hancockii]
MKANDFSGVDLELYDFPDPLIKCGCLMLTTANDTHASEGQAEIVIVEDAFLDESNVPDMLMKEIKSVMNVSPSITASWEANMLGKWCIFLAGMDLPILSRLDKGTFEAIQQLIATARGILWVTRHSKTDPRSLGGHMVIGLARTVRSETGMPFATLDLGERESMSDLEAAKPIQKVFSAVLSPKSHLMQRDLVFTVRDGHLQKFQQPDRPLRLTTGQSRMLDELYFTDDISGDQPLPKGFVEIQVSHAGLNFKDVLMAMGQLHGEQLGQECSGLITRVGAGVTEFRVGDRVFAVSPASLSTYTRCPAACALKIPESMSLEIAASIPAVFCTAVYSLIYLAKLCHGESVLIHAAAGGVGQAAIIVAQYVRAKVFVTVGSEEEKRFLMERYQLPGEQIFYSRDTSFTKGIQQATGGQGVDVALNSLSGDALQATLACVAPFGRFIELGKRDIMQNSGLEMGPFDKNISFYSVDFGLVREKRPALLRRLLQGSLNLCDRAKAQDQWTTSSLPVSEVESGFRALQGGQVIGKLVVQMMDDEDSTMVKVYPVRKPGNILKSDASYIIVGGTGGIGLDLASWFSQQGARNLILISRFSLKGVKALQAIQYISNIGVTVEVCRCDISNLEDVKKQLVSVLRRMPPDMLFEGMSYKDFCTVMMPRVHGIWNLQTVLEHMKMACKLVFFINLSSAASFVGNRGQAPYAASGGFMGALAQYPKTVRLPFTTIELPIVRDVEPISVALSLRLFGMEIRESSEGHCVVGFNSVKTTPAQELPFWANDPKLSVLACLVRVSKTGPTDTAQSNGEISAGSAIKQSNSKEAVEAIITKTLMQKLSSILMRPVEEMDPSAPMPAYGLDSLVTIEVRNWITRELEANLQILEILASDSAAALARTIMMKSSLLLPEVKSEWGLIDG